MSAALEKWGARIAGAALPSEDIPYGPWLGAKEAFSADTVEREYALSTGSTNFLYLPRSGTFKRRSGQTIQFDSFADPVGLLPAKWSGKARQMEEFSSESITDGIPSVCALVTKETVAAGLDDGLFSNFWMRDQVNDLNYTVGSEYSGETYADLGTTQTYRYVPLWYESGDGGITRGIDEFRRRFWFSGSRRFLKNGNWWYFPNAKGTPCRVSPGSVEPTEGSEIVATGDVADTWYLQSSGLGEFRWLIEDLSGEDNFQTAYECLATDESPSNINFVYVNNAGNNLFPMNSDLSFPTLSADYTQWVIRCKVKLTEAYAGSAMFTMHLTLSDGNTYTTATHNVEDTPTPGTWVELEFYIDTNGGASGTTTANRLRLNFNIDGLESFSPGFYITKLSVAPLAAGATGVNRLIPSGPLPPVHAGSLAKGTLATAGSVAGTFQPDADVTDGSWLNASASNTNLYASIDEDTADDLDYIQSSNLTFGNSDACTVGLEPFGFTPDDDAAVIVQFRARDSTTGGGVLQVELLEGATVRASSGALNLTTTVTLYQFQLTPAEIAAISDWDNLNLTFKAIGFLGSNYNAQVTWAAVTYTPSASVGEGAWRGHDRFLYSVAYRFEDGSVWAPCKPRLPSTTLPDGFNMFTVNEASPEAQYEFITWSNIPIGPHGVVGRLLLRTPKVNATVEGDELKLNEFDFRVVWELTDNTTTTYVDYQADDFGLAEDPAGLFVRYDHLMPPRARYIAGGDMRVIHAYGGRNPCAIIIAPVGRDADYDLNLADTSSTAYSSQGSWLRYDIASNGTKTFKLVQGDGASATNTYTITLTASLTLQSLVDEINSTNFTDDGQQWRAQLCPGANPEAVAATVLTPHVRVIASVVTVNTDATITKSAGGLSAVPVGAFVSGTGITAGTYVTRIDSDTSLELSANATASGTVSLTFYADTGDTAITGELGWQRVIANSLPAFLYFNEPYLDDDPIDKSSVWMTVATPGSMKSAANSFSGKVANRFKPPADAGISMGGGAVDQGFVLPFSGGVYALKNTRDSGSGVDEDYKLVALNENRGCCAWNTVTPGNRFVPYLTPDGLCVADLENEFLISEALFLHSPATGSLSYEITQSIAATAQDVDTSYATARVMRSAIWLNYRHESGHPARQVVYDFSSGSESNGLAALFRAPGKPWGWSVPLVRSLTAMCQGRRDDGPHLYGWNDGNSGSTGDGRVDEFETSDTDNGTAISAELRFPWERAASLSRISLQDVVIEHAALTSATTRFDIHWSLTGDVTHTLTLAGAATGVVVAREPKMVPQAARAGTTGIYAAYRQTAGAAAELRKFWLRVKSIPSYN